MVFPVSHGILHATIFPFVTKHAQEIPTEIGITTRADGRNKVDGRGVSVTSEVEPFVVEAMMAGESHARIDASLLQS